VVAGAGTALELEGFDIAALRGIQPYQFNRKTSMVARLAALQLFGRPVPLYSGLRTWRCMNWRRPWRLLKEFLGTARRCAQGRI
jgi:hypothetical protein